MLSLRAKARSGITIGDDIAIMVWQESPGFLQLGIHAPRHLKVLRVGPWTEEEFKGKMKALGQVEKNFKKPVDAGLTQV